MVDIYYDLFTDFYEYGCGKSFHFAPRNKGDSFKDSLVRHEHFLGEKLSLKPGMEVLDLGCGVGGPMREIARFTGAKIIGLNNNPYQLAKCEKYNSEEGLASQCRTIHADFMSIPYDDNSFDTVYAIESIPHASDKTKVFQEIYRVLKNKSRFAGYGWCLTDKYDDNNPEHHSIKKGLEKGAALPDISYISDVIKALESAGLDLIETLDLALTSYSKTPWYLPLKGDCFSFRGLLCGKIGRNITHCLLWISEKTGLVPNGSKDLSDLLIKTSDYLVESGEKGIFTPMLYFLTQKESAAR